METIFVAATQEITDVEQSIMASPAGAALCCPTRRPGLHVDWFIRERTSTITRRILREHIAIEARTRTFERDGVLVVPVMFKLALVGVDLFESWLNVHAPFRAQGIPSTLATQHAAAVHLYGDRLRREASVLLDNFHREMFGRLEVELIAGRVWSMSEFDRAKARLQSEFPTPKCLWDAMSATSTMFEGRRVRMELVASQEW